MASSRGKSGGIGATETVTIQNKTQDLEDNTFLNLQQQPDFVVYEESTGNYRYRNNLTGVTTENTDFKTLLDACIAEASSGDWIHIKARLSGGQYIIGSGGITITTDGLKITGDMARNTGSTGSTILRTNTNSDTILTVNAQNCYFDNILFLNGTATGVTALKLTEENNRWGNLYFRGGSQFFANGIHVKTAGSISGALCGGKYTFMQGVVNGIVLEGTATATASLFTCGVVNITSYSGIGFHPKADCDGYHFDTLIINSPSGTTSEAIRVGDSGNASRFTTGGSIGNLQCVASNNATSYHIRVYEDTQKSSAYSIVIGNVHFEGNTTNPMVTLEDANSQMVKYTGNQINGGGSTLNPRGTFIDHLQIVPFNSEIRDITIGDFGSLVLPYRDTANNSIADSDLGNINGCILINENNEGMYYRVGGNIKKVENKFILGTAGLGSVSTDATTFKAPFSGGVSATVEVNADMAITDAFRVKRVRCMIGIDTKDAGADPIVAFRDDGVSIGALTITGAGEYDSGAIDVLVAGGSKVCFLIDTSSNVSGNLRVDYMIAECEYV